MRVSLSKRASVLSFFLGITAIVVFRQIVEVYGLPQSLSTLGIWCSLLLIPFVHRPTVFGLLLFKSSFSIYNIVSNGRAGISVNGIVSNVINLIATIIFAEILYRMIDGLRNLNKELVIKSQKATTATQAKASFLANMSHEIRTPISGIRGVTDMLLTDDDSSEYVKKHLSMIKASSDTLLHIVNNVLNFTKIEAGKEVVTPVQFSFHQMLQGVVDSLRTTISEKDVSLQMSVELSVPEQIITDEVKIKQILFNLISNAIKFTDKGIVTIMASFCDGQLTIIVADTGIGIPEDKMKIIFTEFERIQTAYEKSREGTGLGLAITKGLVEQLQGSIAVESIPQTGSTFKVQIPVEKGIEPVVHEVPNVLTSSQRPHGEHSILLAEDNPVNQVYLKHFLEKQGYNLTIVENGQDAIASAMEQEYNLILMDIQMPVKSGIQATREIRTYEAIENREKTPILALTASVTEHEQRLFLESGMDDVCPKPVDVSHLLTTMEQYIN